MQLLFHIGCAVNFHTFKCLTHAGERRRERVCAAARWNNADHTIWKLHFMIFMLHGLSHRNSVCPSVRLSVTLVHCVHTVRPTIMISSPYSSPIILVSGDITFIPKFEGGHPERWRWMRVGWARHFWRFSTKSPYLRNGARYDKGYC